MRVKSSKSDPTSCECQNFICTYCTLRSDTVSKDCRYCVCMVVEGKGVLFVCVYVYVCVGKRRREGVGEETVCGRDGRSIYEWEWRKRRDIIAYTRYVGQEEKRGMKVERGMCVGDLVWERKKKG